MKSDDADNVLKCWFSEQPHRVTPLNGRSPNAGWLVEYTKNRFVLKKCVRNHDAEWLHYLEDLTDALLDHGFPIQPMIEAKNQHKTILFKESIFGSCGPILKEDHMKWEIVQMNKKPFGC